MKEEDLTKAIELKKQLDSKRELFKFVNRPSVNLRVYLKEGCDYGGMRNMDYLLGDSVIEELKSKVIANIEERINELQKELEKL